MKAIIEKSKCTEEDIQSFSKFFILEECVADLENNELDTPVIIKINHRFKHEEKETVRKLLDRLHESKLFLSAVYEINTDRESQREELLNDIHTTGSMFNMFERGIPVQITIFRCDFIKDNYKPEPWKEWSFVLNWAKSRRKVNQDIEQVEFMKELIKEFNLSYTSVSKVEAYRLKNK